MEVERRGKYIVADIKPKEIFDLQEEKTIFGENKEHGDRPAVTMPDAIFEVSPLNSIEPDDSLKDLWENDRLEKARKAHVKAHLFSNGDLKIFIPAIKLRDARLSGAIIPRRFIETPGIENGKELVRHVIPRSGIKLNFGGSLKVVNIPDYFI